MTDEKKELTVEQKAELAQRKQADAARGECKGVPEYDREPEPKQWAQSFQPTNYIPPGWDPLRAQAMGMTPQELWNREHGKQDPFTAPKPGFGRS